MSFNGFMHNTIIKATIPYTILIFLIFSVSFHDELIPEWVFIILNIHINISLT